MKPECPVCGAETQVMGMGHVVCIECGFGFADYNKITVRDFFAGCALIAIVRQERAYPGAYDYKAREAYKHADAMLEARKL